SIIQNIILIIIVFLSTNFIIYVAKIHFTNIDYFLKTALNTSLLLIILYFGLFYSSPFVKVKITFWKKISGYFVLVLMVLIIIFVSLRQNNQRAILIAQKIELSNEIVLKSQKLFSISKELESNSRLYVISGDQKFLEAYNKELIFVDKFMADLDTYTSSNANLNSDIDSLNYLVRANIKLRNHINNLRLIEGFTETIKANETISGQMFLTPLNRIIQKIENKESQMLSGLKVEHNQSVIETSKVILLFQVVITLLLIVAFVSIYNNSIRMDEANYKINSNRLFLENILDNIPNMLFVKRASDLKFETFNKAGEELLGVSRDELLGKNDYDLFPGEQAEYFVSEDRKVLDQNKVVDFPEEKISTKFGDKWLHTRKIPVKDIEGKPLYMIGISEDITQRKQFNDNLNKATEEIFDLYNNVPCGYHSIDADGIVIAINNTELNWLGYERIEVIGKLKITDFLTESSKKEFINSFPEFKKNGYLNNKEYDMVRKNGNVFPVILSASAIYDDNGKFLRSRSTIIDYTEPKRLNEQIIQFNLQLEHIIEQKTAKLKKSNEELERFAYVASHDLQEPLRMVTSFLNLLEKRIYEKLDETEIKYIRFAVDGAERMKELIKNLLEYSRLGVSENNFKDVDCNIIIQNVINLFKFISTDENINLVVKKLPVIKGNESQILQLFQNLIGNSIKYKGANNLSIEVGCEDKNEFWQFYVKDNGLGIDPKFHDQIFIIFKRLHNRTEYEGTGVGLSICQKIVHGHGGEIWVDSNLENGSTFYFTIPKILS
ncbi:MAG: PAS domain-containing protein, partial [Ferruginibacter sp.]